jgi:hypothetical protein
MTRNNVSSNSSDSKFNGEIIKRNLSTKFEIQIMIQEFYLKE